MKAETIEYFLRDAKRRGFRYGPYTSRAKLRDRAKTFDELNKAAFPEGQSWEVMTVKTYVRPL